MPVAVCCSILTCILLSSKEVDNDFVVLQTSQLKAEAQQTRKRKRQKTTSNVQPSKNVYVRPMTRRRTKAQQGNSVAQK